MLIMRTVSLAEAKAHLSELVNQAENGEEVIITRHGQPVARIAAVEKAKHPVQSLATFRANMPAWRAPSSKLIRTLRDEER
jgi:prevent-host-death family protein